MQRVNAFLGRLSYNRWAFVATHEQVFGRRSSTLLMNAAFAGMTGFIIFDAAQHREGGGHVVLDGLDAHCPAARHPSPQTGST